ICRYHSCLTFGCEWALDGIRVDARFFLASDDALVTRVTVSNSASELRSVAIEVVHHQEGQSPVFHLLMGATSLEVGLQPHEERSVFAVLAREVDLDSASARGLDALGMAESAYARLLAEDAQFFAACPTLSGDWPAHWREGLHHDFQTTRLLVQPAGGIFTDVWP